MSVATPVMASSFATLAKESSRPDRLVGEKTKEYHIKHARWTLNGLNTPVYNNFIRKSLINWSFYKNRQWIFHEDLTQFFKDESGDIRHRIKFTQNVIRPLVEQFIGNAVRLNFNARVRTSSKFTINRRDRELKKMKFLTRASNEFPEFAEAIKERVPVGETEQESEEIFRNLWSDSHEETLNNLLRALEEKVDIEEMKVRLTRHLAITGIGIYKDFEQNLEYQAEVIDPLFFWFDPAATRPDLQDASFMGDWTFMDTPAIFERFQDITGDERQAIEKHAIEQSTRMNQVIREFYGVVPSNVPVFETYWRDIAKQEFAYVLDEYGYPLFTEINSDFSKFKDEDIIDAPTEEAKKRMEGKKKVDRFVDVLRHCIFIPKEEIGNAENQQDIVLEWGVVPFQDKNRISPSRVPFPYHTYCWAYDKGEILSPIDDAINPQRFMNRLLSASESLINRAGGTGVVLAKQAMETRDGEAEMKRDVKLGNPITVDIARTGSVGNAVGKYDASLPAGAQFYFNLVKEMGQQIQNTTGINEAMTGTEGGQRQLVGVVESRIQRGTLVQEPFYFALSKILLQAYESMVSKGRRIYAESPRRLAIIAGDEGAQEIIITKEMKLEDFRMDVKRVSDDESQIDSGNNLLINLLQMGLIDRNNFANLFGRANSDKIADAMRQHAQELNEAEKAQRAQQAQQAGELSAQIEQQNLNNEKQVDSEKLDVKIEKEKDRLHDITKIDRREAHKTAREGGLNV